MKNTQKYVITFATDPDGKEVKYRFMLSLSRTIKSLEAEFTSALMSNESGVDNINVVGRYTCEVNVSRAFDADEVIEALKPKLDAMLSDIVVPRLIT